MLYDNAMALPVYAEAYQVLGNPRYKEIIMEIFNWLKSEMYLEGQGFYATLDADSEQEEGKYYVWTKAELQRLLSIEQFQVINELYEIGSDGNFEHGQIILRKIKSEIDAADQLGLFETVFRERLMGAKRILLQNRKTRVFPHRDEKLIVSWNGLLLHGLFSAYRLFIGTEEGDQMLAVVKKVLQHIDRKSTR